MKKAASKTEPRKRLNLVDRLHEALKAAGFETERDGWMDWSIGKDGKRSDDRDDFCEWIDVSLYSEDGTKYEVHFYFSKNATKLDDVTVYKCKKKTGYKSPKLLAKREKESTPPPPPKEPTKVTKEFLFNSFC